MLITLRQGRSIGMQLYEGMDWPPKDLINAKYKEHAVWYSGDPNLLADYYFDYDIKNFMGTKMRRDVRGSSFWGRQIQNKSNYCVHVPIAGDIAETSAAFLFGESPIIRLNNSVVEGVDNAGTKLINDSQDILDEMLVKSGFFNKILEAAESCSALGGCFIKICWDSDIMEYPIPVVVQADEGFPEFKFGHLKSVTFPYEFKDNNESSKVYRMFETYSKGKIERQLFCGNETNIGKEIQLTEREETKGYKKSEDTFGEMLAFYIPNMLPNRLMRGSDYGRSDYQGIESMMDSLDETFSAWMTDVKIARGRIHAPASYFEGMEKDNPVFNMDQDTYVKIDLDPTNTSEHITATQFELRSAEFEQTALNLLERIITSAGYSPQSFGLCISGRAESGLALNTRERKSFATTNKKESYWEEPLKNIVKAMCIVHNNVFNGGINAELNINIEFADGITNNIETISSAVKMLSDASAISTDTKVRMVHPEWNNKQVEDEVARIDNASSVQMPDGFGNYDVSQMGLNKNEPEGTDEVTEGQGE